LDLDNSSVQSPGGRAKPASRCSCASDAEYPQFPQRKPDSFLFSFLGQTAPGFEEGFSMALQEVRGVREKFFRIAARGLTFPLAKLTALLQSKWLVAIWAIVPVGGFSKLSFREKGYYKPAKFGFCAHKRCKQSHLFPSGHPS